jgi:hypothetical protein
MRLLGHSDQGGRPDGIQVMVSRGYAYIGHFFSGGITVLDVRDPRDPQPVRFIPAPPNTWNLHLQTHDDLLLVINGRDLFGEATFADKRDYYSGSVGNKIGSATGSAKASDAWTAGMTVFDISNPAEPRQIGFMPVDGLGIHRIWYTGGRWAYVSALLYGFTDYILLTVDMSDPTRPREAGRCWLPGMNAAAGEKPSWPEKYRYALHHAIVHGDTAYGAWRDGGLGIVDVADRANPKLIAHRNWCPPFGGGTHNCLPLPDRDLLVVVDESVLDRQQDGVKLIWLFDIREPSNPVSISTFPTPQEADYPNLGGVFGPHNVHENRPEGFVSSDIIFATYQNAGVRAFDIRDRYRPVEIAAVVPPPPARLVDPRPGAEPVIQSCDVFADKNGILYVTDNNAGLYTMELRG